MVEIGLHAIVGLVEGDDELAIVVAIGVEAPKVACVVAQASEPVDTRVVVVPAGAAVVWTARRVGERPEIVVERVVLLHDDHDVLNLAEVAIGGGRRRAHQKKSGAPCDRTPPNPPPPSPRDVPPPILKKTVKKLSLP